MGMALGTIPPPAGGRPPEAKLTTPGGYLEPGDTEKDRNGYNEISVYFTTSSPKIKRLK